jgi:hypothetical protein
MNMVPAGEEGVQQDPAPEKPQEEPEKEPQKEPSDDEKEAKNAEKQQKTADFRVQEAFRGAFRETWERVIRKEITSIKTAARKKGDEFDPWFDEFLADHHAFAGECLRELASGYCLLRGLDATSVVPCVLEEYKLSFRDRVDAWRAEPSKGYDHREDKLAIFWTERLLYSKPHGEGL